LIRCAQGSNAAVDLDSPEGRMLGIEANDIQERLRKHLADDGRRRLDERADERSPIGQTRAKIPDVFAHVVGLAMSDSPFRRRISYFQNQRYSQVDSA
jgi:hypothetical protein